MRLEVAATSCHITQVAHQSNFEVIRTVKNGIASEEHVDRVDSQLGGYVGAPKCVVFSGGDLVGTVSLQSIGVQDHHFQFTLHRS